jgi:hypothetical protein
MTILQKDGMKVASDFRALAVVFSVFFGVCGGAFIAGACDRGSF